MVEIKTEICQLTKSGHFIIARFQQGAIIDEAVARYLVETRKEITEGKTHLMFLDGRGVIKVTKEARDFLASEVATEGILAGAFLVSSPLTRILGNFFLRINKPNRPSKIFTSEAEAKNWLNKFLL